MRTEVKTLGSVLVLEVELKLSKSQKKRNFSEITEKKLMHTFLHFVVSLQSRFYTLHMALIFVFDVNIYSSSL